MMKGYAWTTGYIAFVVSLLLVLRLTEIWH